MSDETVRKECRTLAEVEKAGDELQPGKSCDVIFSNGSDIGIEVIFFYRDHDGTLFRNFIPLHKA